MWNSERYVEKCFDSLFIDVNKSKVDVEVFAIDNGSNDKTLLILEQIEKKYPNIKPIKLKRNLGTTASRNIAIGKSSGEYIFILDSDTEVQPGTLGTLIATIEKGKKIGIVAPRLLYPKGLVQPSCKKFPTAKIKLCKFLPFRSTRELAKKSELYNHEIYGKEFNQIMEVDYCISAAWLVNREAISDVGLLDEKIVYAPEDVDYCLRMWLKGWKVVYNPLACVIHYARRESYRKPLVAWRHTRGLLYYFRKYGYWMNRGKIYAKIPNQGRAVCRSKDTVKRESYHN